MPMTAKKILDIIQEVPEVEMAGLRAFFDQRGVKAAFLDYLPKKKVGKKMKSLFGRHQLDYFLEHGSCRTSMLMLVREYHLQVTETITSPP